MVQKHMRIVMLCEFYPPVIGGVEQHVRNLSAELVRHGHQVAVVTLAYPDAPAYEEDRGVRVYRVQGTLQRATAAFSEGGRRYAAPIPDPEMLWTLRTIIRREQPEIIHAHNWLVHSFLPIKRWSHAKLVLTLHDYSLVCAKKSLIYRDALCSGPGVRKCVDCSIHHYGAPKGLPIVTGLAVMRRVAQHNVDMFLPVSRAVALGNCLAEQHLPFEVIPNFVPDNVGVLAAAPDPRLSKLPAGDFLLFVGVLSRHKGVEVLLRAYSKLQNVPPLVLIGSPWHDTPTEIPPNVVVLHDWPHAAVMQAWQRSMLALTPSVWPEPCPTVVMEAMAVGRPVIGSAIGGLLDLVDDGVTGLLVPPGDESALGHAIQQLVDDPALRAQMGQRAQHKLTHFQAGSVVPRIEHVYGQLVAGRADAHGVPQAWAQGTTYE